jgi:hypothetical protein
MDRPIGDVLSGIEIQPLPDGWVALGFHAMLKCLDEDGNVNWISRFTTDGHVIESLGAMRAAVVMLEAQVQDIYEPDDAEDA